MQKFKYRAMGPGGKIAEGEIEAADYKDTCRKLRAAALSPISVGRADGGAREPAKPDEGRAASGNLGGERTALAFFKKLLQLSGSGGMPVGDALKSLAQRSLDKRTKTLSTRSSARAGRSPTRSKDTPPSSTRA